MNCTVFVQYSFIFIISRGNAFGLPVDLRIIKGKTKIKSLLVYLPPVISCEQVHTHGEQYILFLFGHISHSLQYRRKQNFLSILQISSFKSVCSQYFDTALKLLAYFI